MKNEQHTAMRLDDDYLVEMIGGQQSAADYGLTEKSTVEEIKAKAAEAHHDLRADGFWGDFDEADIVKLLVELIEYNSEE